MKIAYLSDQCPQNINLWSGTPFHIFNTLKKKHDVVWIGGGIMSGIIWHQKFLGNEQPKFIQDYSPEMGEVLSKELKKGHFDLVISSNYLMCSDLDVDIPIIYFNDIVFSVSEDFFFKPNPEFKYKAKYRERKCLTRADAIIFSSEFTEKRAISNYNLPKDSIRVVEFGANIQTPKNIVLKEYDINICRLVFVGRNWENKGGSIVLEAYRLLKQQGFQCQLTIIGSVPSETVEDKSVTIIPWLDKSKPEDINLYHEILRNSHFMVLPTKFDAFGIVFCEASAYGVPSIASNVGGVSQPVKEGKNGYLLPPEATAKDYAEKIRTIFENRELYTALRISSRREFEKRLNWDAWETKVNEIIFDLVKKQVQKKDNINKGSCFQEAYLPVYVLNLKERLDRLQNVKRQFEDKDEYHVTYIEAIKHENGAIGLWESICKAVRIAQKRGEDIIVLCEDDHEFTKYYRKEYLFSNIVGAYKQGAELLNGGIGGFGNAIPIAPNRSWVDWFWCTQFVVIFDCLFSKILDHNFKPTDTADGVLSALTQNAMAMFPPISTQKNCGYSDIVQHANQESFQKNLFETTNRRLKMLHHISRVFAIGEKKDKHG